MKKYLIEYRSTVPDFSPENWHGVAAAKIDNFFAKSAYHPERSCKALHDGEKLYCYFESKLDRYILSTRIRRNTFVYKDTCLEFFFMPVEGRGHFNFEINAGGTLHLGHIRNPKRINGKFLDASLIPTAETKGIEIVSSLPRLIDPEMPGPMDWQLGLVVPFAFFEQQLKMKIDFRHRKCSGNFNCCSEANSHPHWATWNAAANPSFHAWENFGEIDIG